MSAQAPTIKKRRWQFPTAYSVLFIVLILAASLTYLIPSGLYAKLSYNNDNSAFTVLAPTGEETTLPATQETLDSLNVKINLEQFTEGGISKPIAIPNTYENLPANPTSISDLILAPIEGVYDTVDIMLFVLIIGGIIGILNASGAINAGFSQLSRATQGREYILIVLVTSLIAIGGTTFGMAEETVALYPIMIPIFLVAGYDALVGVAAIYIGSCIGTLFSTVNPFSTIIASAAAGTNYTEGLTFRLIGLCLGVIICVLYIWRYASKIKRDPSTSLVYGNKTEIEELMLKSAGEEAPPFTGARMLMLLLFLFTFLVMVWGVSTQGWWFSEMTALFFVSGLVICFVASFALNMREEDVVGHFVSGAADLVGVGLIIGVARGVNLILDNGMISDSILYFATQMVTGMSPYVFVVVMMFIFIILGFFISSSSGLAVLTMPIMAPLADTVGLPRDIVVSTYQYGQGLMAFITPTGLVLVALALVHVGYDKWIKFVLPLMGMIMGLAIFMLLAQVYFS